MAKLRLNPDRDIDTDHIADIEYKPAGLAEFVTYDSDSMDRHETKRSPTPSRLSITLKSEEDIYLEGGEADAVWADYQKTRPHNS